MASNKDGLTKKEALAVVSGYCSKEEKCFADVRNKLVSYKLAESDIVEITEYLVAHKFVDELRYARAFANDKYKFNKWGKYKIGFALKQKQIPENFIEDALSEIDEQAYLSVIKEELLKKLRTLKDKDTFEIRNSLYKFGISRGFESDTVLGLISEVLV